MYPIPKSLWESLDAVLYSKGLSLAKEVAKELGLPPQPLIALLNNEERGKFTIVEDDEANPYQCCAITHCGATWMRCRHVTLGLSSHSFCGLHQTSATEIPTNLPSVRRILANGEIYMMKDQDVYSLGGVRCGKMKDDRLILFEIE
jgi:hypothetical protein